MEMIDGPNLQDYVTEHGVLDEARAIAMAIDIAEALKAVHDIGMVHGDVKPGNVLLAPGHRTKIVDFGLVRDVEGEQDKKIRGTPYYLAPEQCAGRPADHRADIFSLGATLFFALTGKRPGRGPIDQRGDRGQKSPAPRRASIRFGRTFVRPRRRLSVACCGASRTTVYATYDDVLTDLRKAAEELTTSAGSSAAPDARGCFDVAIARGPARAPPRMFTTTTARSNTTRGMTAARTTPRAKPLGRVTIAFDPAAAPPSVATSTRLGDRRRRDRDRHPHPRRRAVLYGVVAGGACWGDRR